MLSLKDDLANTEKPRSGPTCSTCEWYANLDKAARQDFDDYVGEPNFSRAHLYRVIHEKWGYPSCDSSLKYHLQHHHGSR